MGPCASRRAGGVIHLGHSQVGPGEGRPIVIGRVVTSPSVRGTGLGRPLMRQAMQRGWQAYGTGQIHVSAQAHLVNYYGSLGFYVTGEGYDEDGIPHLPMDWGAPGESQYSAS